MNKRSGVPSGGDIAGLFALYCLDYPYHFFDNSLILCADCFEWLRRIPESSLHAVVTDPPYGVKEYDPDQPMAMAASGVSHPLLTGMNAPPCPALQPSIQKEDPVSTNISPNGQGWC